MARREATRRTSSTCPTEPAWPASAPDARVVALQAPSASPSIDAAGPGSLRLLAPATAAPRGRGRKPARFLLKWISSVSFCLCRRAGRSGATTDSRPGEMGKQVGSAPNRGSPSRQQKEGRSGEETNSRTNICNRKGLAGFDRRRRGVRAQNPPVNKKAEGATMSRFVRRTLRRTMTVIVPVRVAGGLSPNDGFPAMIVQSQMQRRRIRRHGKGQKQTRQRARKNTNHPT